MPYPTAAFAAGWRHHLWLALLVAASLGFTFGFACAVPFAAFGAIAAMTLPRRDALLLTLALWLVNQAVGFTVLHYPWDATTVAWGAILGGVALLSTVAAQAAIRRRGIALVAVAGFAAAFVAYEGALYLVSATVMGGTEDFSAAIVLRILAINTAGFAALLAAGGLIAAGSRAPRAATARATRAA
ncbi:MAG TPA: hypothetical protein VMB84_13350 [Stellaceae bacterium]|nr:hypothetical protein [Stellaceae bacterium]